MVSKCNTKVIGSLRIRSRHVRTIGYSHYPRLHSPLRLRHRSRSGRGRDVYEYESKVEKKNGTTEQSENEISIVDSDEAFPTTPYSNTCT